MLCPTATYHLPPSASFVTQFFNRLEPELASLPNPLELSHEELARHVRHMAASTTRLVSLASYSPGTMAQRYLTRFFNLYKIVQNKRIDISQPGSQKKHLVWRHELEYLRTAIHSFSSALEKDLMFVPRNDDLTLQMAYDMTIVNSFFRQLFVPAAFPKASWWQTFRFNLSHHPTTKKKVVWGTILTILAGGTIGCAYALYKEHQKRTAAEDELEEIRETETVDPHEAALAQKVVDLLGTTLPPQSNPYEFLEQERARIIAALAIDAPNQPTTLHDLISQLCLLYWRTEDLDIDLNSAIKNMLPVVVKMRPTRRPALPRCMSGRVTPQSMRGERGSRFFSPHSPSERLPSRRRPLSIVADADPFEILMKNLGVKDLKTVVTIFSTELKRVKQTVVEPVDDQTKTLQQWITDYAQILRGLTTASLQSPGAQSRLNSALVAFLISLDDSDEIGSLPRHFRLSQTLPTTPVGSASPPAEQPFST